jgi:hypothetical protein
MPARPPAPNTRSSYRDSPLTRSCDSGCRRSHTGALSTGKPRARIFPEDVELRELPDRDRRKEWHEVVPNPVWIFTEQLSLVHLDQIESYQQYNGSCLVRLVNLPLNFIEKQFCVSVSVRRGGSRSHSLPGGCAFLLDGVAEELKIILLTLHFVICLTCLNLSGSVCQAVCQAVKLSSCQTVAVKDNLELLHII